MLIYYRAMKTENISGHMYVCEFVNYPGDDTGGIWYVVLHTRCGSQYVGMWVNKIYVFLAGFFISTYLQHIF